MLDEKSSTEPQNDWLAPNHVRTLALVEMALLALYLCYRLVEPFLSALVWAIALAAVFAPLQQWLEKSLKRPNLAATVSITLIALIVVLPTGLIAQQLLFGAAGIIPSPLVLTFAMVITELWPTLGGPAEKERIEGEQLARFENEGGHIK